MKLAHARCPAGEPRPADADEGGTAARWERIFCWAVELRCQHAMVLLLLPALPLLRSQASA